MFAPADRDQLVTAEVVCENVLECLKSSNLNFLIQESPYSVYVTIRKRFLKNSPQKIPSPKRTEEILKQRLYYMESLFGSVSEENVALKSDIENKRKEIEALKQEVVNLENKSEFKTAEIFELNKTVLEVIEKENEKQRKIERLEEISKKLNNEFVEAKTNLSNISKSLKVKDKENFNLNKKNENLAENMKRLKSANIG